MSETPENGQQGQEEDNVISLKGMYEDYFLDYASYVILERAVPAIADGLKPVQRRILHAMKQMDDGRYHKVANIIGQTMQYHPHGDAAIGDALVKIGQKDLLIDTQGNWGNVLTGDNAAAPRYIEARLTKFALEVAFNPNTTEWQLSYDGRKNEPVTLPMKFPLLLAQGVEGIAVGLSTKIMPHNFLELIKACIKYLEGKKFTLYPDFQTGGSVDVSDYQGGKRGGKIKVRAKIEQMDKSTIVIKELPYGVTTSTLKDSIIKAADKGKIKIKRIIDNTAKDVEVQIELASGTSPELTIDALYAFTNCEVSISPNACVIINERPEFLSINDILRISAEDTRDLLRQELEIQKAALEEKWHMASLEKIFIENRIYREIEECESFEEVIEVIGQELKKYISVPSDEPAKDDQRLHLMREITREDIEKLTEIRIKRISKYNSFKADEYIAKLEEELKEVKHHLANLTDYTIAYYERLLDKYGEGKERKTEIETFDTIQAAEVVANNAKLYANLKEGFIGTGLKKDTLITDCSDIDDIIVFRKDGHFQVSRIAEKVFVGKDIIHVAVWKKGDERTTYNMAYLDAKSGRTYVKRFHVKAVTRDRAYDLTKGAPKSKVYYFSANPNGEAETIEVRLTQGSKAKKKIFDFDFAELAIKGRNSQGNILTKYPVRKIEMTEQGKSTLGAMKIWMDEASGRLNNDERGLLLGSFDTGDQILAIYKDGSYEMSEIDFDLNQRYVPKDLVYVCKYEDGEVLNVIHYEGEKGWTMVKRFEIETNTLDQKFSFISESKGSKLIYATVGDEVKVQYKYRANKETHEEELDFPEFIDVKGWKAVGNKLTESKVTSVKELEVKNKKRTSATKENGKDGENPKPGDTIDLFG
ncbi:MAG TPA: DNA gyrase/topoisomerase IV subunit A [Saprospiraceae bacterium]|nr:DNA gyrase/topoisomerase IV subunit A [Saprospiraceae bacterium]